jgi:1-acyl-sn-glycerol-3-phosphate acyltransferase
VAIAEVDGWYRFAAGVIRPLLFLVTRRDWQGQENIPATGPAILVVNHISYMDPLVFTHFIFDNGRAPRYLGKESIFRIPFVGRVLRGAGQIPVHRETESAREALLKAVAALKAGEVIGIYPEATITRDPNLWPMTGKTGAARLALMSGAPVIPCAQWGAQRLLPPYSKRFHLFPPKLVHVHAGPAIDLSQWLGKSDDQDSLTEVTIKMMSTITSMLAQIRQETPPESPFDWRTSGLPRTGNFKKRQR